MFSCLTDEDTGPQLVAEVLARGVAGQCRPLSARLLHPSGSCPALPHPCVTNAGLTLSPGHSSPSLLSNLGPWHGLQVRRPSPRRPAALRTPSQRLLQFPQGLLLPRTHSPFTKRHSCSSVPAQSLLPQGSLPQTSGQVGAPPHRPRWPCAPALGGTCHPAAVTVLHSSV